MRYPNDRDDDNGRCMWQTRVLGFMVGIEQDGSSRNGGGVSPSCPIGCPSIGGTLALSILPSFDADAEGCRCQDLARLLF